MKKMECQMQLGSAGAVIPLIAAGPWKSPAAGNQENVIFTAQKDVDLLFIHFSGIYSSS